MFEGLSVALVTPFREGKIDEPSTERLVDFVVQGGTDVLVVAGTTGEAPCLTRDERRRLYQIVKAANGGRARLVAGTGTNNTRDSIELTEEARAAGYDGALVVVPYYNKPTAAGQIAHFTAIAKSTDLPLILYNVPGRTGTNMSPDTVARLSQVENIVAIKEASGSLDHVSAIRARCDLTVLSGDDSLTLPMLAIGARGVISVAGNAAPRPLKNMLVAFGEGRLVDAETIHRSLVPLMRALFIESNPGPVKSLLADMGLIANELRLPLVPVERETARAVRDAARAAGVTLKESVAVGA
ncbi:MAG: 4-hydroxy-tetrahydrodipicolinate synthase [Candidatus Eiseniibacteriota bacterium]